MLCPICAMHAADAAILSFEQLMMTHPATDHAADVDSSVLPLLLPACLPACGEKGGAIASHFLNFAAHTVSVGASGAIFGLFSVSVLTRISAGSIRGWLEALILGQFVVKQVKAMQRAVDSCCGGDGGGVAGDTWGREGLGSLIRIHNHLCILGFTIICSCLASHDFDPGLSTAMTDE